MTFSDFSTQAIENLCSLLKRNKRLQHVNLCKTGLTEYMIVKIAKAMRRAKALCSIHLDGNPGVTPRVKEFVSSCIRAMPQKPKKDLKISEKIYQIQEMTERNILQR